MLEMEVENLRKRSSALATQVHISKIQTPLQLNRARLLAGDVLQVVRKQDPTCY